MEQNTEQEDKSPINEQVWNSGGGRKEIYKTQRDEH